MMKTTAAIVALCFASGHSQALPSVILNSCGNKLFDSGCPPAAPVQCSKNVVPTTGACTAVQYQQTSDTASGASTPVPAWATVTVLALTTSQGTAFAYNTTYWTDSACSTVKQRLGRLLLSTSSCTTTAGGSSCSGTCFKSNGIYVTDPAGPSQPSPISTPTTGGGGGQGKGGNGGAAATGTAMVAVALAAALAAHAAAQ